MKELPIKYKNLAEVLKRIGTVLDSTGSDELKDPNQPGLFGNRPLGIAARWGDVEAIAILLAAGAKIDGKGEDGFTPLHDAIDEVN